MKVLYKNDKKQVSPEVSKKDIKKLLKYGEKESVKKENLFVRLLKKIQFRKYLIPKKRSLSKTPSFTPNPNIDYKIQRMVVDDSFDYKILDAGPHVRVPDDLLPRKRKFDINIFPFRKYGQDSEKDLKKEEKNTPDIPEQYIKPEKESETEHN